MERGKLRGHASGGREEDDIGGGRDQEHDIGGGRNQCGM